MGDYNPYQPQILGQEWVPIRDEDQIFSPAVNAVEVGHSFALSASRTLTTGRFYVNTLPPAQTQGQVYEVAVYAQNTAGESGPIRSVIIPCNSGGVTGAGFNGLTAAQIPIYLASPSDSGFVECTPNADANPKTLDLYFATSSYSALLTGKRIIGVNLLHSFSWQPYEAGVAGSVATPPIAFSPSQALELWTGAGVTRAAVFAPIVETYGSNLLALNPPIGRPPQAIPMSRVRLGEVDHFWQTPSTTITSERAPWRYTELARFEGSSGSDRIRVHYDFGGATVWAGVFYIGYAALEVIYCEEQRVAHGLTSLSDSFVGSNAVYTLGANLVTMRDAATLAVSPVLASGDYTVVLSSPDVGDLQGPQAAQQSQPAAANTYASLNACRELYQIPPHPGVRVDIPFPLEDHLGETFTQTVTHVLPQISLHATGGTMTEPHVYGRQVAAQVYGAITATQDIYDDVIGIATTFPQVRFYARRYGNTTVPLTLTGENALSASTVSITPTDFDALPEIVDRWKEVTLTFGTPPSMGAVAGYPAWTWSATAETAGNRWEILGASAPAISGTPGNSFNLVPYPNQLGPATYGAGTAQTITYISTGVAAHDNNAPVTPGMPASIQRGDLLLILAAIRNSPTGNPDAPTGYTQLLNASNMRLFGKIYDGSEGAPTVNFSDGVANATTSAQMAAFRNVTFEVVTSANTTNGSQANIDYPALSSAEMEDDTLVLFLGWRQQDWTSVATIAGATEIGDPSSGAGDNQGIVWDYVVRGAAAAVGSGQFAVTGGINGIGRGATLALRHAAPGAEVELTWMPQGIGSGYVSSPTADQTSDAAILFSQDPPTVTGVSLSQSTQTVTGIGLNCASLPCCIPTGIGYQRVTWSATSLPTSGFGAYELQRFDAAPGASFGTVMLATSPLVTGFNDFEARVGIDSVYRIRALNVYNFAGAWSTQVTGAPPTPGVTGGCSDATGALIFTSNSDQSGASNAAYVMQWDSDPVEDFMLPEGDAVTFQPMYGRDGVVAFHGTERGLETFSRTLLIQAAAIDPVRLADVKTLRDLAWADLPYVCVRDDIGDRWYANVRVPTVNARLNRTEYMARVDIVEVTTTPAQVDP